MQGLMGHHHLHLICTGISQQPADTLNLSASKLPVCVPPPPGRVYADDANARDLDLRLELCAKALLIVTVWMQQARGDIAAALFQSAGLKSV